MTLGSQVFTNAARYGAAGNAPHHFWLSFYYQGLPPGTASRVCGSCGPGGATALLTIRSSVRSYSRLSLHGRVPVLRVPVLRVPVLRVPDPGGGARRGVIWRDAQQG